MSYKSDKPSVKAISDLGRQFSDTTIAMHEAIARRAGLSGTDHKYLGLLMQKGSLTAGELAKLTGLTTGAVTGLIDRLEKKNLVKREFDQEDRRKIIIVPNVGEAMRLLGGTFADLQNRMVKLISKLEDKEVAIIENYLKSTIAVMKSIIEDLQKLDPDSAATNSKKDE